MLGAEVGTAFTAVVQRVFATGHAEQVEYALDVPGGRRWFLADIKPIEDAAGKRTAVMIARDITERRETEEALARSEERYRLAARATRDRLWDCDLRTGVVV